MFVDGQLIGLRLFPDVQVFIIRVVRTCKTVQVKNGAELFWREEKRTKKIGEEN